MTFLANNFFERRAEISRAIPLWEFEPRSSVFQSSKLYEASQASADRMMCMDCAIVDSSHAYGGFGFVPFSRFVISKHGRALIADDMGLGKTVQAIGVASYYRDEWPLLVVCPSSMRFTWSKVISQLPSFDLISELPSSVFSPFSVQDILYWLPNQISEDDIFVVTSAKDILPQRNRQKCVIIASYDMMVSLEVEFVSRKFKIVILVRVMNILRKMQAGRCQTLFGWGRNLPLYANNYNVVCDA